MLVGRTVGRSVGRNVGDGVGTRVGDRVTVGVVVGAPVGDTVGVLEPTAVGGSEAELVGESVVCCFVRGASFSLVPK